MPDADLRSLEREGSRGDLEVTARLNRARCRAGEHDFYIEWVGVRHIRWLGCLRLHCEHEAPLHWVIKPPRVTFSEGGRTLLPCVGIGQVAFYGQAAVDAALRALGEGLSETDIALAAHRAALYGVRAVGRELGWRMGHLREREVARGAFSFGFGSGNEGQGAVARLGDPPRPTWLDESIACRDELATFPATPPPAHAPWPARHRSRGRPESTPRGAGRHSLEPAGAGGAVGSGPRSVDREFHKSFVGVSPMPWILAFGFLNLNSTTVRVCGRPAARQT